MRHEEIPSVITCDLEGRIETFNEGAERLFGYRAEEVVGKKRVSLFSPGLIVLGHVGTWLAEARKHGRHDTTTVFQRKDGTRFAADIRVTPTFHEGRQIGYCGVTQARPDLSPEAAMPKIGLGTRIFAGMVVTRAPFLTATIVPVLLGAAAVASRGTGPFPWGLFALVLLGAMLLHVAANTFNDYFDWTSGTDPANTEYFQPFSGGSRSIELGLITERGLLRLAFAALAGATAVGAALTLVRGPGLLLFGLIGAFSAYFYTAPPLRLAARKGLGELLVGMNFGPLIVAGTAYTLGGTVHATDLVLGLAIGLLTTAILWVNQFPDAPSDELTGKHNLVVVLGRRRARWGWVALVLGAFAAVAASVAAGGLPAWTLLMLLTLPLALKTAGTVLHHFDDRQLASASAATIGLHLMAGLLLTTGLLLHAW